jgi:protocatechuate 3,4-dioxygenase, alpha subunit
VKPGALGDGQAPHINVTVLARGLLQHVVTRIYFPDETEANAADPLLSSLPPERAATLVAEPAGDGELRFDIRLQGEGETVFLQV